MNNNWTQEQKVEQLASLEERLFALFGRRHVFISVLTLLVPAAISLAVNEYVVKIGAATVMLYYALATVSYFAHHQYLRYSQPLVYNNYLEIKRLRQHQQAKVVD